MNIFSELINSLPKFSLFLEAGFVLLVFWIINIILRFALLNILRIAKFNVNLVELLIDDILWLIIWVVAIAFALSRLGVNLSNTFAGVGFIGVAVGLAAKDSIGNIISGVLIFWDKPFAVGDWIEIENKFGQVKDITMRTTRIQTRDNTYVIVPNQNIINSALINHSVGGPTRIKAKVSIGYNESIDWARKVLLEITASMPEVLSKPEPDVIVKDLGESGIELELRVWLDQMAKEQFVHYKLNEEIRKALGDAQIEIPYPYQNVVIKK